MIGEEHWWSTGTYGAVAVWQGVQWASGSSTVAASGAVIGLVLRRGARGGRGRLRWLKRRQPVAQRAAGGWRLVESVICRWCSWEVCRGADRAAGICEKGRRYFGG